VRGTCHGFGLTGKLIEANRAVIPKVAYADLGIADEAAFWLVGPEKHRYAFARADIEKGALPAEERALGFNRCSGGCSWLFL